MRHLSLCFFLIFLGASFGFGLSSAYSTSKASDSYSLKDFLAGKSTLSFEKKFDETLRIRDFAKNGWGVFEYGLFYQGRKNIVTGYDGWLFSVEEYAWPKNAKENIQANISFVKNAIEQLNIKSIPYKIILIPSKARQYPSQLIHATPPGRAQLYDTLLLELSKNNIHAEDIRKNLSQNGMFFKTDTHWTTSGALSTALAVFPQHHTTPAYKLSPAVAHEGDLLRYLPLGSFAKIFGYTTEPHTTLITNQAQDVSAQALFDDVGPQLHLIGTSYSANDTWGFAKALEIASGISVVNYAQEGQGPFTVMKSYLEKTDISKPQLVVWEIPERYFPYPFEGPPK